MTMRGSRFTAVGRAFDGRIVTGPDGRPESVINTETDRRFAALTGRPEGQRLDPRNPADASAIAQWNSIHNAVIAERHLTAEIGGKPADQAVAEIDAETNEMFWRSSGYKPGQPLNPHVPSDAQYIPEWLSIRYAVAQEYARNHAGGHIGETEVAVSGRGGGGRGVGGQGRRRLELVDDDGWTVPIVGATGIDGSGFGVLPITELNEIDSSARALNDALQAQMLKSMPAPTSPAGIPAAINAYITAHANDPRVVFYTQSWIPWKAKWNAFYADQSSFLTQATDLISLPLMARERYFNMQPYRASLLAMYKAASGLGVPGLPAEPAPPNNPSLPTLGDWKKYAEYGAIALGAGLGIVVVANVAGALRGK